MSFTATTCTSTTSRSARSGSRSGRTITEADIVNFAGLSGDFNPIHIDHEFAKTTPFRRPIAHGLLVCPIGRGLGAARPADADPGVPEHPRVALPRAGLHRRHHPRRQQGAGKQVRGRGRRGEITWQRQIFNQDGKVVRRASRSPSSRAAAGRTAPPADAARPTLPAGRGADERVPALRPGQRHRGHLRRALRRASSPRSASSAAPCGWSSRPSSRRCWSASTTTSRAWSAAARWPTRRHRLLAARRRGGVPRLRRRRPLRPVLQDASSTQLGIDIGNPVIVGETTGTCVCLITPDAERTMRTCLAVSSHLAAQHVDEARLKNVRVAVHRGLRLRQPADGPGGHPRGDPAREEARRQGGDHGDSRDRSS